MKGWMHAILLALVLVGITGCVTEQSETRTIEVKHQGSHVEIE